MRGRERGERGSREKKAFLHSLKKKKKGRRVEKDVLLMCKIADMKGRGIH